jgi:hypothetical protein
MIIECFLHLTTRTGVHARAIPTKTAEAAYLPTVY